MFGALSMNVITANKKVVKAFDVGHGRYIETASGTRHMYFLLGTDTKPINNGMRCKDYLQEVFLIKKYPRRVKKNAQVYGYPMRNVGKATKLYLHFPNVDMLAHASNIEKCITYINNSYDIDIEFSICDKYVELHMGKDWFVDKINPTVASVITTLLRSCLIWEYDTFNELLENIDDIEDKYDSCRGFPDKDWNAGKKALEFLCKSNLHKKLGTWKQQRRAARTEISTDYHNSSGWHSVANVVNFCANISDAVGQLKPATLASNQCVIFQKKEIVTNKPIKNRKEFVAVMMRHIKKSMKTSKDILPVIVFNNGASVRECTYSSYEYNPETFFHASELLKGTSKHAFMQYTLTVSKDSTMKKYRQDMHAVYSMLLYLRLNTSIYVHGSDITSMLTHINNCRSLGHTACMEKYFQDLRKKNLTNKNVDKYINRLKYTGIFNVFYKGKS